MNAFNKQVVTDASLINISRKPMQTIQNIALFCESPYIVCSMFVLIGNSNICMVGGLEFLTNLFEDFIDMFANLQRILQEALSSQCITQMILMAIFAQSPIGVAITTFLNPIALMPLFLQSQQTNLLCIGRLAPFILMCL